MKKRKMKRHMENPYVFLHPVKSFSCFAVLAGGYADKFVKLPAEMFGIIISAHLSYFRNVV